MIPFRRIVVSTDFSLSSEQGVRYAEAFASSFGGEILLTHVVEPAPYPLLTLARSPAAVSVIDDVREASAHRLHRMTQREDGPRTAARSVLREGLPSHELVRTVEDEDADLLVIATHGHTGLKHVLMGSTAEKVVRTCPCPVLTVRVREPGGAPSVDIKKILFATDFSDSCLAAASYAGEIAAVAGATIVLVHVMHLPVDTAMPGVHLAQAFDEMTVDAEHRLDKQRQSLFDARIPTRVVLREGRPYDQLVEVAKEEAADLIVIGTHGHTGLKHAMLGSTAERVVRHASCPVLTVRERTGTRV